MNRVPTPDLLHQALLGEAADSARVGITVYDDDGRYVAVNRYATELLGYSRDDVLSHDIGDFTKGGIDRSVLQRENVREGVRVIHHRDGSTKTVAFLVAPTRIAGLPYFVAVWWELEPDDPRVADAG
ncbi:MAG: PAS domain S-box protein [Gaiellaceae bacterium]